MIVDLSLIGQMCEDLIRARLTYNEKINKTNRSYVKQDLKKYRDMSFKLFDENNDVVINLEELTDPDDYVKGSGHGPHDFYSVQKRYLSAIMKEVNLKTDKVILQHGTTDVFLENILKKGLLSRKETNNSTYSGNIISNPDLVYLGFMGTSGLGWNITQIVGGNFVNFEVVVDTKTLVPDEDSNEDAWWKSIAKIRTCATNKPVTSENILSYYIKPDCDKVILHQPSSIWKRGVVEKKSFYQKHIQSLF